MLVYDEVARGTSRPSGSTERRDAELEKIAAAIRVGRECGLGINAGHGLNYRNVLPVAAISEIDEFNIGHAIVGHAILVGMERAVREMKALLVRGAG